MIKLLSAFGMNSQATSQLLRITVISLTASVLFVLLSALFWGQSIRFKNGLDLEQFWAMSYEQQQLWRDENQIVVSGVQYFFEFLQSPQHWLESMKFGGLVFFLTFASSWFAFRGRGNGT